MVIVQANRSLAPALGSATAVMGPVTVWRYDGGPSSNSGTVRYRPWDRADIFLGHFVDGQVTARTFDLD